MPAPPTNRYGVPLYHDGRIKRRAVTDPVRRLVALREGGVPGETVDAKCSYCGAPGQIYWPRLRSGKPGSWVSFPGLHLDHIHPYSKGGSSTDPDNLALACLRCNSSKCDRLPSEWKGLAS